MNDKILPAFILGSLIGLPILYGELKNETINCANVLSDMNVFENPLPDASIRKHIKIVKLNDETDGEKHVMIVAGDSKDGDAEMKRQVKVTIGSDVDAAKSLEDKILSELENNDFDSENVNIQIKVIAD